MTREPDLTEEAERVLAAIDDQPLRLEEIVEQEDMDFETVRSAIHDLWERNLVVSGPNFTFEADRGSPPNLKEQ